MEAARLAVANHTARRGHTTEVHETVLPAVTRETVKPTRHEILTTAVDKEVHQHHYHTTVQPLTHVETLPTKHTHMLIPIKHTEHMHEDKERTRARVAAELAVFKNSQTVHPVAHTRAEMPAVIGEHVHHHVHETVQPVIFKEVHQPEIVHTTVPVHETHHFEPVHHGISELGHKTLAEFTKLGGIIAGSKSATLEKYEGAPRPYKQEMSTTAEKLGFGPSGASVVKPRTHTTTTTTTSTNVSAARNNKPIPAPITTTPMANNGTTSTVTPTRNVMTTTTVTPNRNTTASTSAVTPGLVSPSSNVSSPRNSGSMPSTPTHAAHGDNTRIRDSENFGSPKYETNDSAIKTKQTNGGSFMDKLIPGRRSSEKNRKAVGSY